MENLKYVDVKKIIVETKAGCNFSDAAREALMIAVKHWQNITLIHNDRKHEINVMDLFSQVKNV